MREITQAAQKNEFHEMSLERIEEIRSGLRQRRGGLEVNRDMLFKHTAALPPATRAGVLIAGWGPFVLFPFAPVLYFYEWKLALFTIFLCIFWVGMGRKYAEAAIRRQCYNDSVFLKFALAVDLVKLA